MSFVEVAKMAFFLRLVSCGKGVSCRSGLSERYKHQHHPFVCHILDYASTVWDLYTSNVTSTSSMQTKKRSAWFIAKLPTNSRNIQLALIIN